MNKLVKTEKLLNWNKVDGKNYSRFHHLIIQQDILNSNYNHNYNSSHSSSQCHLHIIDLKFNLRLQALILNKNY